MRLIRLVAVACAALLMTGCTMARIYATSGNSIAMTQISPNAGESVTLSKTLVFDYTGAIDVQELVRSRYGSGVTLQNASVKVKTEVTDFLLNMITFGIANARTFEITGDVLRREGSKNP